jgi:phosphoribosylaminoimidazole carboxylase (NCAIR synthetase)
VTSGRGRRPAILLIGGHLRQIRLIEAAREVGLVVAVTDRSADAPARPHADRFAVVDATDVDGVVAFAERLDRELELVGAYGIADYAFAAVGAVVDRLGLAMDGSASYHHAASKDRSRRRLHQCGVAAPKGVGSEVTVDPAALIESARMGLRFPVVVKPAEGMNSDGVVTVREFEEDGLAAAIALARRYADGVVVEELVEGRHFNVDGLLVDGALHPVCITERFFVDNDWHVALYAVQPAEVAAPVAVRLNAAAEAAGRALGFRNGPMTADVILGDDGPMIIEASPHYHSVTTSGLLDDCGSIKAWLARLKGDDDWARHLQRKKAGIAGYYLLYHDESGVLEKVEGLEALRRAPGIIDLDLRCAIGGRIDAMEGKPDLCAVVSFLVPGQAALSETLAAIAQRVRFHTSEVTT